jgi:hypothetical protein
MLERNEHQKHNVEKIINSECQAVNKTPNLPRYCSLEKNRRKQSRDIYIYNKSSSTPLCCRQLLENLLLLCNGKHAQHLSNTLETTLLVGV